MTNLAWRDVVAVVVVFMVPFEFVVTASGLGDVFES